MRPKVAVIGLGVMGTPIAHRLLQAGYLPEVWNRTPCPVPHGASTPALHEIQAEIVLTVLPDIPQLRDVLDSGLGQAMAARASTLVVMSTSSPRAITDLQRDLLADGIRVIDAPMSGGDRRAWDGDLSLMVGGWTDQVEGLEEVFGTFATSIVRFGQLGSGSIAKLCNQVVVAATLASIGEAIALAQAYGLDEALLLNAFAGGLADSAVLRAKADKLLARTYSLGGSVTNQVKDLGYALEAAARADLDLDIARVSMHLYEKTKAAGYQNVDHSAVYEVIRRR